MTTIGGEYCILHGYFLNGIMYDGGISWDYALKMIGKSWERISDNSRPKWRLKNGIWRGVFFAIFSMEFKWNVDGLWMEWNDRIMTSLIVGSNGILHKFDHDLTWFSVTEMMGRRIPNRAEVFRIFRGQWRLKYTRWYIDIDPNCPAPGRVYVNFPEGNCQKSLKLLVKFRRETNVKMTHPF